MPSSAIRIFTDPDDYASAIRQGSSEVTVTQPGRFSAEIVRIDFNRLWMQRFTESTGRIKHTNGLGGRAVIAFPTRPGPGQSWNGVELTPANIIRHKVGGSYFQRSAGAAGYAAMSLPVTDLVSVGAAIAGRDLTPPRDASVLTPSATTMAKLQHLHAAAGDIAKTAPEVIAHPEAAHGLEQALIEAMVACLTTAETSEERWAQRRHSLIMQRFYRLVAEYPGQPLYVPEICKSIGVAERTLRVCCQEQLGTSPKHFLMMRRMQLARRDLKMADSKATTVTEIAARYGFWQFGQFAATYRSIFGELPSVTLARKAE